MSKENRRRVGVLATAAAVLAKAAPLLKLGLIGGKAKVLVSMLLSVGAYTVVWGWRYALGFVLLLFVHELGHVAALRQQGVKASLPMFIPFLGAVVEVKERQRSVAAEAASALAGPVLGASGSYVVYLASQQLGSSLLQALAYTGFLINVFNLVPVLPLDGGRVAGALSPRIWLAGMAAALVLLATHPSPVLLLVLVFGGMETISRWRNRHADAAYLQTEPRIRALVAGTYVTVAVFCLWGMHISHLVL